MTTVHYGSLLNRHDQQAIQGRLPIVPMNLLFASYDRVAIDAVASRVLRLNPLKIYYLYLCVDHGCGTIVLRTSRSSANGSRTWN